MAFFYKKVIKYQHVTYDFTQALEKSRESYILAFPEDAIVATINNKKQTVEYLRELPQKVKYAIENFIKE